MCWESTISQKFLLSEETISKLIVIRFKQDSVLAFLRGSHRFFLFFIFLIAPHIFWDVRKSFLLCFMYWILSSKSTRGQWPILWSSVLHSTHGDTAVVASTGQPSRGKCTQSISEKGTHRRKGLGLGKGHSDPNNVTITLVHLQCVLSQRSIQPSGHRSSSGNLEDYISKTCRNERE